jgi:hypothetical protein
MEEPDMNEMGRLERPEKQKFREVSELTSEQLNDPDFRLKQIDELNRGKIKFICGKCGPDVNRLS